MHLEGGHNKHYETWHDKPEHSKIAWPTTAEEESVADAENRHFADDFVHSMHRDHEIMEYHREDADQILRFEDPHFHAPLTEHDDHDPIVGEHRPSDEDFYTFEKHSDHMDEYHQHQHEMTHQHEEVEKPTTEHSKTSEEHLADIHSEHQVTEHQVSEHLEKTKSDEKKPSTPATVTKPAAAQPAKVAPEATSATVTTKKANETPMYVRPYLEDPIFLQPDDAEVSLLHPGLTDHTKE